MTTKMYYTVIRSRAGYSKVKFAQAPTYEVQEFPGIFADHGQASQEFRVEYPDAEYLDKSPFSHKIRQHQQDFERLKSWTGE